MVKTVNFENDKNTEKDDLNWLAINFDIDYLKFLHLLTFKTPT